MLNKGSIISFIDATSEQFRNYGSSVMNLNDCKMLNHAIVIVSIDKDKSDKYFMEGIPLKTLGVKITILEFELMRIIILVS